MLFGKKAKPEQKKEETIEQNNIISTPAIKEEDVHVMPGKFVAITPDVKKSGAKTMTKVLLSLFFLLVLILGGAAWYLWTKNKPNTSTNQNLNNNQVVNNQNNSNTTNNNTNSNTNNATTTNNNINVNSNQNTNTNTNINSNTNTNVVVPSSDNQDSDKDGLTLLEENLYNTSQELADTDKDGYKDGAELLNLYDPTIAGGTLTNSSLVKVYKNTDFKYQLLMPKKWLVQSLDDSRRQINFVPDSATGEIITIKVTDNTQHLELADWQKSLLAGRAVENYRMANYTALKTGDGKQVLFVNYDYVFLITYDQAASVYQNFPTTFNMMLKTFALEIKENAN